MVRTRRPRKGSASSVDNAVDPKVSCQTALWKTWLMDFEIEVNERLHKLNLKLQNEIEALDRNLMLCLNTIPPNEAKYPPHQPARPDCTNSSTAPLLSIAKAKGKVTGTASKLDSSSNTAASNSSRSRSRKRSLSESGQKEGAEFTYPRTRSSSQHSQVPRTVTKYQTPANKGNRTVQYVTPKVDLYCPMPLKRYARQGEMAISLEGSPLMMTTSITEPNICLPINNGQEVYSILPAEGPCPAMPLLDNNTKQKLMMLRNNLDQLLGVGNESS